ncbi:glycoside hydrolase family 2 TIM barrel-domain containing protein [Longitalea luteola]|uniref:glycoside hydrolase family 2 TIM barrel-domain containing protein n=1 Tax=Longitalea luteola TaxID=2812563 RepID=UPI001A956D2F|nr:glycoside hydrolase family 2 TIM barrel-domain containing protein [Longitalea luteola]
MKKTILHLLIMHGILTQALAQGTATHPSLGTAEDHSALRGLYGSNDRANNNIRAKLPLPALLGQQGLANNNFYSTAAHNRVFDSYIERVTIDAKASGDFTMQVFSSGIQPGQTIEFQVLDPNGKPLGEPSTVNAAEKADIKKQFSMIRTWNPENPHLYQIVLTLKDASKQVLYTFTKKFGFRTVESKPDGIYVNGVKVIFKGINRRSAELGNARTSEEAYLSDINTMKDLNMNAVRLSYYPVDPHFFDLCDSIGLFVISELTGPDPKKMIKDVVFSGLNHPSVVCWSTGPEHASNKELDKEFDLYDVQNRYVIHPVAKEGKKNSDFNSVANSIIYGTEAFTPVEIGNGIYNGGRAAGLDEFWTEMSKSSKFSGTFLASYRDENGIESASGYDIKSKEKWASYYAIKEIWAPLSFDISNLTSSFNGVINVENKFLYTNLTRLKFNWKLVLFPKATQKTLEPLVVEEGKVESPYTGPGEKGQLKFNFTQPWIHCSALVLSVLDNKDKEVYTWTFPIMKPEDVVKTSPEVASISTIMRTEDPEHLSLVCDGINYIFDKKNGNLTKVYVGKRDLPFNGPFLAGVSGYTLADFKHLVKDNTHTVDVTYKGENTLNVKWTFHTGDLPRMDYSYSMKSPGEYVGITFKYPEEKIVGMKWFGRGPFQVWKNRLKGQQLGVWEKSNRGGNNAEFKGWHADVYWVQFQTNMGNFTFYTDQPNMFLQMFSPLKQGGALLNEFSTAPFPDNGNIGFMHHISGLGTKPADNVATKSLKSANEQLSGSIYFDFRW